MGRYIFSIVMITVLVTLALLGVAAGEAQTEAYKDNYIIGSQTYRTVSNDKFVRIHNRVKRYDKGAARGFWAGGRDYCDIVLDGRFIEDDASCKRR